MSVVCCGVIVSCYFVSKKCAVCAQYPKSSTRNMYISLVKTTWKKVALRRQRRRRETEKERDAGRLGEKECIKKEKVGCRTKEGQDERGKGEKERERSE